MNLRDVATLAGIALIVAASLVWAQPVPPPLPPDVLPPDVLPPPVASNATLTAILLALTGLASATLPQFVSAYRSWLDNQKAERQTAETFLEERALGREAEMRRIADRLDALEARVFGPGHVHEEPPPS